MTTLLLPRLIDVVRYNYQQIVVPSPIMRDACQLHTPENMLIADNAPYSFISPPR